MPLIAMTREMGSLGKEVAKGVAETLGIPVGTVQSRLLYAIRAMRAGLVADARPARVAVGGRA